MKRLLTLVCALAFVLAPAASPKAEASEASFYFAVTATLWEECAWGMCQGKLGHSLWLAEAVSCRPVDARIWVNVYDKGGRYFGSEDTVQASITACPGRAYQLTHAYPQAYRGPYCFVPRARWVGQAVVYGPYSGDPVCQK